MDKSINRFLTIDLGDDRGCRAITADNMSDQLAAEIISTVDVGDYELTNWDVEFIGSNLGRTTFTPARKRVIYKYARKFNLL